jgi:hypothetical protein
MFKIPGTYFLPKKQTNGGTPTRLKGYVKLKIDGFDKLFTLLNYKTTKLKLWK